jgi:hypothetical protein
MGLRPAHSDENQVAIGRCTMKLSEISLPFELAIIVRAPVGQYGVT